MVNIDGRWTAGVDDLEIFSNLNDEDLWNSSQVKRCFPAHPSLHPGVDIVGVVVMGCQLVLMILVVFPTNDSMISLLPFSFLTVDLPKVTEFTLQEAAETSVLLTWAAVPGVSTYILTWRLSSGNICVVGKGRMACNLDSSGVRCPN